VYIKLSLNLLSEAVGSGRTEDFTKVRERRRLCGEIGREMVLSGEWLAVRSRIKLNQQKEIQMKKIMLFLAVLFLSASATSAFAKDICVLDGFGNLLQFNKVQLLKGRSTQLSGRIHYGGFSLNSPLHGVVTVDSDNVTTRIAFTIHGVAPALFEVFAVHATGDKLFNASGSFDQGPFTPGGDGAYSMVNAPCSIVLPALPDRSPGGPISVIPE
jgi:hypothetical protein